MNVNQRRLAVFACVLIVGLAVAGATSAQTPGTPPTSAEVAGALNDFIEGFRAAHASSTGTVTVQFLSPEERVITFDGYDGSGAELSGTVTVIETRATTDHYYEVTGLLSSTTGSVLSIEFSGTPLGYANAIRGFGGTIIVNGIHEFNAQTFALIQ